MFYQRNSSDQLTSEKLLQADDEQSQLGNQRSTDLPCWIWKIWALTSTSTVFFLLLILLFQLQKVQTIPHPDVYLYSPAKEAVEYKLVVFNDNFGADNTIYQGPPTDAVDDAWEELYNSKLLAVLLGRSTHSDVALAIGISQINRESAKQLPNKTAPVPGAEGQYIVGLDVFHQLHCLNHIRKALYPERYHIHQNLTEEARGLAIIHLEHCIDSIRQSIQCSSDISTIYWEWAEDRQASIPNARTTHVCKDFRKIQEWAKGHRLGPTWDPFVHAEDGDT